MTTALANTLFIQIGRKRYQVASLKQASEMYCTARDASGLGASQMPPATIVDEAGAPVARISYNGCVWPPVETAGERPLYDNREAA